MDRAKRSHDRDWRCRAGAAANGFGQEIVVDDLIEDELRQVLADWNAGKPVRSIALGHTTRVDGVNAHGLPAEMRNAFRQRKALAYVFQLIEAGLQLGMPFTWDQFFALCLDERDKGVKADLTQQEIEAAESLAWKALLRGWNRALAGFPDAHYISIGKEKAAA
jgi:hypothetical protein